MINLVKQTRKLLILDHHISSKLDLEDIAKNDFNRTFIMLT